MEKKQPLIAVVGPTASGKTAVGVELAKIYNGEVVSADSMQTMWILPSAACAEMFLKLTLLN